MSETMFGGIDESPTKAREGNAMLSPPDHSFVVPSISRDMRALYDAHFAFVWRYMAHRGVPVAGIDDLVQQVFRIVREHPSRHDASRSRSVLVCMVSRQVLREHKKRTAKVEEAEVIEGVTMNFSRHAAGQVLDAVLEGMTETQREVLLLSQGENMSNRDIGDALGVPEAVLQQRLEAAAKLMTSLVGKLRMHPIWDSLPKSGRDARALMDAAQRARTPTDADKERVYAAMLAVSMTGGHQAQVTQIMMPPSRPISEPVPVIAPSLPVSQTPTLPPPEPVVQPVQLTPQETQELYGTNSKKPVIWAGVAFAAVAVAILGYGLNSYLYASKTNAQTAEQSTGTAVGEGEGEGDKLVAEPELAQAAVEAAPAAAAAAPTVEPLEAPEEEVVPEKVKEDSSRDTSRPAVRSGKTQRRAAPPAKTPHRFNPADEPRQLFAAERAFRAGESKLALDMLNDLERQHPQSRYEAERDALRAQILCERGRTKAARKVILELEAENADKPLLAAVDQACQQQ